MARFIRTFLIDDHAMVREGLAALLSRAPEIQIVGQCGEGTQAVEQVSRTRPHVVVLDLALPGINGLDLCHQLTGQYADLAVLVVTMYAEEAFMARAFQNGAKGYLLKESAGSRLVEAVRAVARGQVYLGPGVPPQVAYGAGKGRSGDPYSRLTPRERQVLHLIAEGKNNRQMAELLGISPKTVETHRANLMHRLEIHNQAALVKFALRHGLINK